MKPVIPKGTGPAVYSLHKKPPSRFPDSQSYYAPNFLTLQSNDSASRTNASAESPESRGGSSPGVRSPRGPAALGWGWEPAGAQGRGGEGLRRGSRQPPPGGPGHRSRGESLPGASRHPAPRGRGENLWNGCPPDVPDTKLRLADGDVWGPSSAAAPPANRRRSTHPGTGVAGVRRAPSCSSAAARPRDPGRRGRLRQARGISPPPFRGSQAPEGVAGGPASVCRARSGRCARVAADRRQADLPPSAC